MRADLERAVRHLAGIDRRPTSAGERESALWIADELRGMGLQPRVEAESAKGGFWWQLFALNTIASVAGFMPGRLVGVLAGAAAARGAWDEFGLRRRWTRTLLPDRTTWNVSVELGDPTADRTLVVAAHHDAAPGGLFFDQTLPRTAAETFKGWHSKARRWPPVLWWVPAGGVLVALGSALGLRWLRRAGAAMSAVSAAGFGDIALRPTSPGANDNATSVAAALAVTRRLVAEPPQGLRVIVVFPGCEESFEEGMLAFLDRHAGSLPTESTSVLALEMLGAETFLICEGEGPLTRIPYDDGLKDLLTAAAGDAGVEALREYWSPFGSDALAGIRRGYPSAMLVTVDHHKLPSQYHSPADTPENVDFANVERGVQVVEALVRRMGGPAAAAAS